MKVNLQDHVLVPKHEILKESEAEELLKLLGVSKEQLPKIKATDPIVKEIGAKPGDIVKITRKSHTADFSVFYRLVIE
ncbi:MAG: DNA-directed RNA polymerase subunit H [Archaeoglobaceae archaeon]|nr:DNA-directed RNA polymerase subunit H [Archaeoglobaceae archaeon]MDW8119004.1 DNA-directed RNA polymerase subunit H [Archaeoglobaceae archaeon]